MPAATCPICGLEFVRPNQHWADDIAECHVFYKHLPAEPVYLPDALARCWCGLNVARSEFRGHCARAHGGVAAHALASGLGVDHV